jgi:hypothetical protein
MNLSEVKTHLSSIEELRFILPNGDTVPTHFHITEVGIVTKRFVDCGGKLRNEEVINFQLWEGPDRDHRLAAKKLKEIIELSEKQLQLPNVEIEVEYQSETIGKYDLAFDNGAFALVSKNTACLALESCGIPTPKLNLVNLGGSNDNVCTPGGGCC